MKRCFGSVAIGIAIFAFLPAGWADNEVADLHPQRIYAWVAAQMDVPLDEALPPIHLVTRLELRQLYKAHRRPSLEALQVAYGLDRAGEIVNLHIEDLVGMFNPATNVIHIGRFLSPCRRQAVLAHELTHFCQHKMKSKRNGALGPNDPKAIHMIWEMEAYKIENRFMARFCRYDSTR